MELVKRQQCRLLWAAPDVGKALSDARVDDAVQNL